MLKRAGGFRLTFAAGDKMTYQWKDGDLITLSVNELGDLLAFAANKVCVPQVESGAVRQSSYGAKSESILILSAVPIVLPYVLLPLGST